MLLPLINFQEETTIVTCTPLPSNLRMLNINGSSQTSFHGNKNNKNSYAQFDDLGHGKNELPPLWVDIQESIEEKISEAEKQCNINY